MLRTACLTLSLMLFSAMAVAAEPAQSTPAKPQSSVPKREAVPTDSCYGASNEKDEDLKTGNEELVEQILRQMLNPGS